MDDEEITTDSAKPSFKDFDDVPIFTQAGRTDLDEHPPVIKRKPGRPPGSKNKPKFEVRQGGLNSPRPIGPDARDKVDKQVSYRAQQLLLGATGVMSVVRPSLRMSQTEAQNIADPFAAWATKQGEPTGLAKEILDRWDIIAIFIALLAYFVRVIQDEQRLAADRREEREADTTVPRNSKGAMASARRATPTPPVEEENGSNVNPEFDPSNLGFSSPPAPGF
jgi:hypothetical protein